MGPPRRLVLSWRHATFAADQETELHVRFEDIVEPGRGGPLARVTVEHLGWDAIPADHATRHGFPLATFQLRLAEWWRTLLQRVAGVAMQPDPDPSCPV